MCASAEGRHETAAALHGVADTRFAELGLVPDPLEAGLREADRDRLREAISEGAFDAAYAAGQSLTETEADDLALRQAGD
jgi:hypothetical protein